MWVDGHPFPAPVLSRKPSQLHAKSLAKGWSCNTKAWVACGSVNLFEGIKSKGKQLEKQTTKNMVPDFKTPPWRASSVSKRTRSILDRGLDQKPRSKEATVPDERNLIDWFYQERFSKFGTPGGFLLVALFLNHPKRGLIPILRPTEMVVWLC